MNPINMAKGLLDKHEQIKDTDPDTAAQIRSELEGMAGEVKTAVAELRGLVDPATIELEDGSRVPTAVAADIQATGRRLEEFLGLGSGGGKRTTKAATPPNKTTT
ncbi:MAG: hypothetical protein ACRDP6_44740 [Actinoallomurus sp.]